MFNYSFKKLENAMYYILYNIRKCFVYSYYSFIL